MLIDYVYSIQTIRATEAEARTEPLNHHKHPLTEVRRLVLLCHSSLDCCRLTRLSYVMSLFFLRYVCI